MKTFLKVIKGIFCVMGALFLLLIVIVVVDMITEDDTASSGAPESTAVSSTPEATDPPSQPPELVYTDSWDEIHVGSIVDIGSFSITYGECDSDWRGYHRTATPDDGYKYIRAYFSFENISTTDQGYSSRDFSCYADGVACRARNFVFPDDLFLVSGEVSPGRITQGYVYFEVPVDAGEIELEYEIWRGQEKLIFIIE